MLAFKRLFSLTVSLLFDDLMCFGGFDMKFAFKLQR